MNYLFDTSRVSGLMREETGLASWFSSLNVQDRVMICTITRGEILFGLERLPQGRRRTELEAKAKSVLVSLPCEAIPPEAGDLYAYMKVAQHP